jgi:hypothetical protein
MPLSLLSLLGIIASATVFLSDTKETDANVVAGIYSRSQSGSLAPRESHAALASPAPIMTAPLTSANRSTLPKAELTQPLNYTHVKPMTGQISPAIFQTPQDGLDASGQPRRMALVNIGGGLGIVCREIQSQYRNHQLVQIDGDRVVMRVNPPSDKEKHLSTRCGEAIALLPIGS